MNYIFNILSDNSGSAKKKEKDGNLKTKQKMDVRKTQKRCKTNNVDPITM